MGKVTIHNMEQRSPEWLAIRVGRLGGSKAISLTTDARMKTQIYTTIAEIETGKEEDFYISKPMQEGIDKEPFARDAYEKERFVSITQVGYITNSDYEYAGLSPDGLIGDVGAVEFKCPLAKQHVKTIVDGKVPTEYRPQIAHYFMINENLEWVDFVSYHPEVKRKPLFIIRCTREEFEADIAKQVIGYMKFKVKVNKGLESFK